MNEMYLHHLWQNKMLGLNLTTSDGEILEIIDFGQYNHTESGPDFYDGCISLNGLQVHGNIELHINSSDWFKHHHDIDAAYNNVILHVAYNHDRELYISGRKVPVLELKNHINFDHFNLFHRLSKLKSEFPCKSEFKNIDGVYFEKMKENALIYRLERKSLKTEQIFNVAQSNAQTFYTLLFSSFGNKTNNLPFIELAQRLPLKELTKLSTDDYRKVLLAVSGLSHTRLDQNDFKNKEIPIRRSLVKMNESSWKYKGIRHHSFPHLKIIQLSFLLSRIDFSMSWINYSAKEIIEKFMLFSTVSKDLKIGDQSIKLTKSQNSLILINAIVNFLYWYGKKNEIYELKEKAIDILELLPSEVNYVTKKWKSLSAPMKSAYDSQASLEIYTEFCKKKKCLSCEVGNKLLAS